MVGGAFFFVADRDLIDIDGIYDGDSDNRKRDLTTFDSPFAGAVAICVCEVKASVRIEREARCMAALTMSNNFLNLLFGPAETRVAGTTFLA